MAELTGRRLGEFVLDELLATGGAGEVYAAHQPSLGRGAVVKVIRAATPAQRERVAREARLATRLDHPYAAHVYAFGHEDDLLWIAMERVHGETLADRLAARGHLTPAELVPLFQALCEVVDTAHAAGLVHRDIKPANVMIVERAGRVLPKLLDFGIAISPDDAARSAPEPVAVGSAPTDVATLTGDAGPLVGTPAYMAPEQWQPGVHGPSVDIYALGVVAYRCLAGRLPFEEASAAALLEAHARAPVPPIAKVSSKIMAVLARALAKSPGARPTTAGELSRAFARAARPRRWFAALAVVLAVLLAASAVVWIAWPRTSKGWIPALALLPVFDENADRPLFSPDGRRIAFATDRERTGWFRVHVAASDGTGDHPVTPPELSVTLLDWSSAGLIVADLASEASFRVDPDGGGPLVKVAEHRIVGCGDATVGRVRSVAGCATCERIVRSQPGHPDAVLVELPPGDRIISFRCDAAGRRLAYSAASTRSAGYQPSDVWVHDIASQRTTRLTDDAADNETPVFTRGGSAVVFASARGGRMNLWEVGIGGGVPMQLTTGEGNDYGPDLSPDGRLIYSVDTTTVPLFANERTGERRVTASHVRLQHLAVSPGGETVYATDFAAHPPAIVALSPRTGDRRVIGLGDVAAPLPGGEAVVIGRGAALVVVPHAGGAARALAELPGRAERLRVGRDGVVHAMIDRAGALEAWRVTPGGAVERDAPAPWTFVIPAPSASVWLRIDPVARITEGVVVLAGAPAPPADAPRFRARGATGGEVDASGTTFVFHDGTTIQRLELATGRLAPAFEPGEIGDSGLTMSPDGATIYTARTIGRTRRIVIENFAGRPALP